MDSHVNTALPSTTKPAWLRGYDFRGHRGEAGGLLRGMNTPGLHLWGCRFQFGLWSGGKISMVVSLGLITKIDHMIWYRWQPSARQTPDQNNEGYLDLRCVGREGKFAQSPAVPRPVLTVSLLSFALNSLVYLQSKRF